MDQAALLELLAGKRNASVLAAILQSPKELKAAYEDAQNAEGSALKENEKYMDSIQGRIDQFNNALQTMWSNTLDDDFIKFIVKVGTELVKLLDKLGPIETALAGIAAYAMRKNGINFLDMFKGSAASIDALREKLKTLEESYKKLDGSKSQKNLRKQDKIGSQIKEIQAEIDAYDKLIAKRDEAYKNRDEAAAKLKSAQDDLKNAGNIDGEDLEKLTKRVKDAELEFENADKEAKTFDATVKKTGKNGKTAFANLGTSIKSFTKELMKSLAQMALMILVMKLFELAGKGLDALITTPEEAAEKFEELRNELEDAKQAVQDLESELEGINDQIAELNAQESLSFTDEEELARLKEERAELERELELNEALAKQKQQQVNNQVSDQVESYKNKGVKSGKTTGEHVTSATGTAAIVGASATALAAGSAAAGGANIWNPIGWGLLATAVIASITAAVAYGIAETEEKVGESIENMSDNLKEKEEELKKARNKYQDTGSDGDKKKYEEAQKALSDYRGEMAKYFTDLDAYYKSQDLSIVEDPDEYARLKQEMEDFYNTRDKWLIESGAEGAKSNAIARIFDKEEFKEASANIDALLQKLQTNPGDQTILALIISQVELAKEELAEVGISVDEAVAHFTQVSSGPNMDSIVDPMKVAISAVDTYTSKMQTLASIQAAVADGFIISAEKAREFAAVYPEILQNAKAAADGQIQLNAGVVNALISGERAEANAAMETNKQKIEGTIATLEAKKAYLEAQLAIMEAEAEGDKQLAIYQVELMQERYNQAREANIGEAEAYKLAAENMGLNATEFSKVVADVANDTASNMSGAASQMSSDMYDGYSASADSANAFGRVAANAANAPNNPLWSQLSFSGRIASGLGGFSSKVSNRGFSGVKIDPKILDIRFDNLKLDLTNQLNSVNDAIANAYGALALMDTNIDAPLQTFNPDKDKGSKGSKDKDKDKDDAPTEFEKLQAAYEAAIGNLEHKQALLQGEVDILEAQRKGVSTQYYKNLIQSENDKIALYESQLGLFKSLLSATEETSEEYNQIVKTIHELEKNIQDATLAAIEFGEAMNTNFLKSITDIGDAYENLFNINTRQRDSMELYKEGVEIGGGYVNERWYDDMIVKAQEAGELAGQKLQDALWATDYYRNQVNPFEVGTAEYEGWEFDRNKNLQEAWNVAADAKTAQQEAENTALQLAEDKKDAYIEAWENVATGFERIGSLFEDQISLIDGYESRLEALNINVPDEVYRKKAAAQQDIVDNLDKEIAYDESMLAEYASKYGENDERYLAKWDELNKKRVERYEAETQIIEIEQQIIENQIDRFNQTIDRMNDAVDKMNNIKGLITNEDVADENGEWTAEGLTQAGMNFQEMAYQKEIAAAYVDQMEELTEAYEDGKISEKEYYEQMKQLEDGQWDAINAYKSMEDALIDLEEARIDALEKGLQEEIDAYSELIQLKHDELNAEKDLYEFRESVRQQSEEIAEIERKMASISNSSVAEDRAEYKRLEKELYNANRELDTTYRSHSYDQTSEALDRELETFERNYTNYIEGLRDQLEDTDEFIKRIYADVVDNGELVLETLVELSDKHGFTLDENLVSPWENATSTSLDFEEAASEHYTNVKDVVDESTSGFVDDIVEPWKRGQEESKLFAENSETYLQSALNSAIAKEQEMTNHLTAPWNNMKTLIDQSPGWVSGAAEEILRHVKQNVIDINNEYAKIVNVGAQLSGTVPVKPASDSQTNDDDTQKTVADPPKPDPPKPDPPKPPATYPTGTGVKNLQRILNQFFGANLPITGNYLEKTTAAVQVMKNALYKDASSTKKATDGKYDSETQKMLTSYLNKRNVGSWFRANGVSIPAAMYAKGTLGISKDQWGITDEPQYGDELVLVPNAAGNLSFMRKGTSIVPADLTKRIMELAQMPMDQLGNNVIKAVVPNIETTNQAVQVNFEALVKADNITNDVLPEVEKLVEKQLNNFTKSLNYSLKRVGGR